MSSNCSNRGLRRIDSSMPRRVTPRFTVRQIRHTAAVFSGLHEINWSAMYHAYGTAEEVPELLMAMRSSDPDKRNSAFDRFYSAVHHQGDVYPCTTASLPFLYELAMDPSTPDRPAIVDLLVSIGTEAIERGDIIYTEFVNFSSARTVMRARAGAFLNLASDHDVRVRCAALPGLALFVDDPKPLRDRFAAARTVAEALAAIKAIGTLALRVPDLAADTANWLTARAVNPDLDARARIAAVAQRARCSPDQIDGNVVPTTIQLLAEVTPTWLPPEPEPLVAPEDGVPPFVTAMFADMEQDGRVHAWTTDSIETLHEALDGRVSERSALLTAQLRSPDLGTRLDGIPMCAELVQSWRGNHTSLIVLLGEQLGVGADELAVAAAKALYECRAIAQPAREALAAYITRHGPQGWVSPRSDVRRACQEAVMTLAKLGDLRALPFLLVALDSGIDDWRAVHVAGELPTAADQLVPRLSRKLAAVDFTGSAIDFTATRLISALGKLGDPAAVPVLVDVLQTAVKTNKPLIKRIALAALGRFGSTALVALEVIRPLVTDDDVRGSAVTALWAIGGNSTEVLPLLDVLLYEGNTSEIIDAANVLTEIGPTAAGAVPRLRELLAHNYEWVRVHAAAALWAIGGDNSVLDPLLQVWKQNPATGNAVLACLDRMGPAAAPALPELRTQLALPRRAGRFDEIGDDEELSRLGRTIIARLA